MAVQDSIEIGVAGISTIACVEVAGGRAYPELHVFKSDHFSANGHGRASIVVGGVLGFD